MWFLPSFLLLLLALRLSTCDDSSTVLDELPNPQLSTTSASSVATDKGPSNKETSGPCNRNRTLGKKHDPWVMYERVRNMPVAQVQKQSKTFFERVIDRVELVLQCRREEKQRWETDLALSQSAEQVAQKDVEDAKRKALERKANPVPIDKKKLDAEIAGKKKQLTAAEEDLGKAKHSIKAFLTNQTNKMGHIQELLNNETIFADAIKSTKLKIDHMESQKMNWTAVLNKERKSISSGEKMYKDRSCATKNAAGCVAIKTRLEQTEREVRKITSALGEIEEKIAQAKTAQTSLESAIEPLELYHAKFVSFLDATDNCTAAADALQEAEERATMTPEVAEAGANEAVSWLKTVHDEAKRTVDAVHEQLLRLDKEIPAMEAKLEAMRKGLGIFRNETNPDDIEDTYIAPVVSAICFLISLSATPFAYRAIMKNLKEGKNSKAVMKNVKKIPYAVKISKKTEKEVASGSSLSSNAEAELSPRFDEHRDSHFSSSDSHFVNTTIQLRFTEDP